MRFRFGRAVANEGEEKMQQVARKIKDLAVCVRRDAFVIFPSNLQTQMHPRRKTEEGWASHSGPGKGLWI